MSPQRRKDRQARAAPTKTDSPPPFRHTPATSTEPCRHFPAKINFSPARNRQSLPPHSRRIRTIKELLTQPANGRIRPRTAETPPPKAESSQSTSPGYQFAARRTRSTAPTTAAAATAARNLRNTSRKRSRPLQSQRRKTQLQRSFWKRNDLNSPPKKGLKRESALQTRPPAANDRPSNDGH